MIIIEFDITSITTIQLLLYQPSKINSNSTEIRRADSFSSKIYLSVKHSILGQIFVNVDTDPFNFNSLTELSKPSKNCPNTSYLNKSINLF